MLAVLSRSTVAIADEPTSAGSKTPLMVSFTDLTWTALPEREGMEFAVLSGDRVRKVPAGTDNALHMQAASSRT